MMRFVRKDARIYAFSHCRLCGCSYGVVPPEIECRPITCLACGSRQCMVNGLGCGQCSVCLIGLLPGWSGNDTKCKYKGCGKVAIARGRGRKPICIEHLEHQMPGYVQRQISERARTWIEVEESPRTPYAASQ